MMLKGRVEQSINVSGNRINSLPLNFGGGGGNIGAIRAPLTFMVLSPGVAGTGTTGRVNGQAMQNTLPAASSPIDAPADATGNASTNTRLLIW